MADIHENIGEAPVKRLGDVLWIVIPCYNEEEVLPKTAPLFLAELERMIDSGLVSPQSRICFVDDGSGDRTWQIITDLKDADEHFVGIKLSRNRGHQNALVAGLLTARHHSDMAISCDCDGQDDIHAMHEMAERYAEGYDVVYGVRKSRESDTRFKRATAQGFYRLLGSLGAETVYNHADYRLTSKAVLDELAEYGETNLYLRGIFPMIGFKSTTVEYDRHERMAGESHYPFSKMLGLAMDGITSLSTKPLTIISTLGIVLGLAGIIGIIWVLIEVVLGLTISGWASTICIVLFLGGIQLVCLGIVGEYIGKIYLETKRRPRYAIEAIESREPLD